MCLLECTDLSRDQGAAGKVLPSQDLAWSLPEGHWALQLVITDSSPSLWL